MIRAQGLEKSYGTARALAGLDFEVRRGECYCLLGPNGAGKTTAMKVLTGQLAADGGSARVGGFDPAAEGRRVREIMNIVPQHHALDPFLTVRENLFFYGLLQKIAPRRVEDLSARAAGLFDLEKIGAKRVNQLSGGEYRRAQLARAFIREAPLLFMDEPTANLDIIFKNKFWDLVKAEKKKGVTVLLNTHDFNEAEVLADRIGFVFGGRMVSGGTPESLKELTSGSVAVIKFASAGAAEKARPALEAAFGRASVSGSGGAALELKAGRFDGGFLASLRGLSGLEIESFATRHPTLNDVFRALGEKHAGDTLA